MADDTAANLAKKYSNDRRLLVRVAGSQEDVLNTLSRVPGVERIVSQGEKEPGVFEFSIEPEEGADVRREISERIAARNWAIMGMQSKEMTLEEVFIALTREQLGTTKKGGRSK